MRDSQRSGARGTIVVDGRLLGYRQGGIQRYTTELVRQLIASQPGLDLRLATSNHHIDLPVQTIIVRTPPHHRLERISLGLELALRRPVLVHSPDFIAPHLPTAAKVVTIHDLAFLRYPDLVTSEARRYYGQVRSSARSADHVIAVSQTTAGDIVELLGVPCDRIRVIPNGVVPYLSLTPPEAIATLTAEYPDRDWTTLRSRPIVLAVGTVEPRKRYDLLLGAWQYLVEVSRDMSPYLLVAGQPGWQSDATQQRLLRAEATDNAAWLTNTSDSALRALYSLATCLVVPSLYEGFGLSALEGMAAGLPVVAAARGALPETIGDAGLLLSSDDPQQWAEMLQQLIENAAERERLALLGRARADRFTWRRTAEQTAEVYLEVIGR